MGEDKMVATTRAWKLPPQKQITITRNKVVDETEKLERPEKEVPGQTVRSAFHVPAIARSLWIG